MAGTPSFLKRCVRAVADDGRDIGSSYAICTSMYQKKGLLKKGTNQPTKRGVKYAKMKSSLDDHEEKIADYKAKLAKEKAKRAKARLKSESDALGESVLRLSRALMERGS